MKQALILVGVGVFGIVKAFVAPGLHPLELLLSTSALVIGIESLGWIR
jgi:membrane-bound ClpP family serine protease